jgi:hypothetical protein
MRLTRNWVDKVERDDLDIAAAWDLLKERFFAIEIPPCKTCGMSPCPDESYCAAMRAADEKARRCDQCKSPHGPLEPHKANGRVIYLHAECWRFRQRHR